MADSPNQQIAAALRKLAQFVSDDDFAATAFIYVDTKGNVQSGVLSKGSLASNSLIGALFSLATDHRTDHRKAEEEAAKPTIALASPEQAAVLGKKTS